MAGLGAGSSPTQGVQQQQQAPAIPQFNPMGGLPQGMNIQDFIAKRYQDIANYRNAVGYKNPGAIQDTQNVLGGQGEFFTPPEGWQGTQVRMTPQGMANMMSNQSRSMRGMPMVDPFAGQNQGMTGMPTAFNQNQGRTQPYTTVQGKNFWLGNTGYVDPNESPWRQR